MKSACHRQSTLKENAHSWMCITSCDPDVGLGMNRTIGALHQPREASTINSLKVSLCMLATGGAGGISGATVFKHVE
jgi:hypothetical protein